MEQLHGEAHVQVPIRPSKQSQGMVLSDPVPAVPPLPGNPPVAWVLGSADSHAPLRSTSENKAKPRVSVRVLATTPGTLLEIPFGVCRPLRKRGRGE
jgi:hypothetical protein